MKKTLKIASTVVLVFSIIFTSIKTIAKPSYHKVGFVKILPSELNQTGTCG
jgi:hypothetical protein